ncbi:hypothetical protein [Geofilum rubicundum]|uniref:Uncharacterized protein n=1 Tax=Geofilum rubicundum JCM 15548 TaxID=1236989 RepID=A0A0E9LVH4_9BACT|nr:hypothetical protein [Geofilum rubicundum]GAO29572.1 hypothetical protein JCM15548_11773 [Geofilum rubicundum JCM 15548]
MCRYFPGGTDIVKVEYEDQPGVRVVSGVFQDKRTIALVNFSDNDYDVLLTLPEAFKNGKMYFYVNEDMKKDENGFPVPVFTGVEFNQDFPIQLSNQSFVLLTNVEYL